MKKNPLFFHYVIRTSKLSIGRTSSSLRLAFRRFRYSVIPLFLLRILIMEFISSFVISINAQTSIKIPALNIIGTEWSVNYSTNTPSTTVNTKSNAFDGKLNTYFASYERSGTWVGLDLSDKHVITKIAYAPRNEYPQRLLLGIFEGANNPDFSDAVPLFMITETPLTLILTEQEINCSRGFRYVRYVGPNDARCSIAEIEFYGYKSAGNNSHFPQLTNLPTITISTVNAEEIVSRDFYVSGFVSVINNGTIYSDLLEIRGRGHNSWLYPKKPYRIKLRNKTNLLGFPAMERKWTLINNYGDKTLMRNLLAFDLSKRAGMPYTPAGKPVDVILNGEYKGTYNLCDQVEIAHGRIDIQPLASKDIALPELSGGYFIEVDAYAVQEEEGWFVSALRNTPVRIRNIDTDNILPQQFFYIRDHYNKMEAAIFASNYKHPVNGFRKYIDTESFLRHFLIGEITGNSDTYWSVYMYKERNSDIFKFGPVWDADLCYDNDNRTYPVNSKTQWIYEFGSAAYGFRGVVYQLLSDEELFSQLQLMYAGYRDSNILTKESLLDVVDYYASELALSQRLNFMRWNILNKKVHLNPVVHGSYEAEVYHVKNYISERIDWMDKKLGYVPNGNSNEKTTLSDIAVYANAGAICFNHVTEPTNVSIADMTGRVIFSKSIQGNMTVPVAKGIYFVTISGVKGHIKMIKCLIT